MNRRRLLVLLLAAAFASTAPTASGRHHRDHAPKPKVNRHDPAHHAGYMDGYRQGANDAAALSNAYTDESDPVYQEALDGYSPQYGEQAAYQQMFRRGYIEGYKSGWDFNSGQYNNLGSAGGNGSGG